LKLKWVENKAISQQQRWRKRGSYYLGRSRGGKWEVWEKSEALADGEIVRDGRKGGVGRRDGIWKG